MRGQAPLRPPPPIQVPGLPRRGGWRDRLPRMPLWALLVLPLLGAVAVPAVGLARYTTSSPQFCVSCHSTGETPDRGIRSLVHPGNSEVGCVDCHAKPGQIVYEGYVHGFAAEPERVSPACERCHSDIRTRNDQDGYKFNFGEIRIAHQAHLERGATCVTCHANVAHDLRSPPTNRPRMETCYTCHARTESCSKCHMGPLPETPALFSVSILSAAESDGKMIYLQNCTGCHMQRGGRVAEANASLAGPPTDEALGRWQKAVVEGQGVMPPMAEARGGPLADNQVAAVLAYLEARAREATAPPPDAQALYDRNCASCHGADGAKVPAAPMHEASFWQGKSDDEVRTTIRAGRGSMPAFGVAAGGTLHPAEVSALVDLVRAFGADESAPPSLDGRSLYARDCASCHGADGSMLANSDLSSQEYLQSYGAEEFVKATRDGRGGMPAMGKAAGGRMSDEEIISVVDYLFSR